jgi:glycosyltransferase involved in cell wall biosynthesis
VSHYAGERAGGEGSIPLRLLGRLRSRGVAAWLLTHESKRAELAEVLPADLLDRVIFTGGLPGFGPLYTWGKRMPPGPRTLAWGITQLERQVAMVPVVRRLVRELGIDVVHQPISVSPVIPSPLKNLGAPVVMGPLNGGAALPPAFTSRDSRLYTLVKAVRPAAGTALNRLMSGRLAAAAILVANERTRALLPAAVRDRATTFSDIGVVSADWPAAPPRAEGPTDGRPGQAVQFLFTGRLVDWKGVDLLLDAFAQVPPDQPAELDIVGDGPARARLSAHAETLGLGDRVRFRGWLDPADAARAMRECDVYVTAALQESGGISVLEAMSSARPVIATAWAGHLDTVDERTGVLVGVQTRDQTVAGLARAMTELARDPDRRGRLGAAGHQRVAGRYDWDVLTDQTLQVYADVSVRTGTAPATAR